MRMFLLATIGCGMVVLSIMPGHALVGGYDDEYSDEELARRASAARASSYTENDASRSPSIGAGPNSLTNCSKVLERGAAD